MVFSTVKQLGCCGVLLWLAISAVFATFFIGEYLERPDDMKSLWKAGVQVIEIASKVIFCQILKISRESIVLAPYWAQELVLLPSYFLLATLSKIKLMMIQTRK